MKVAVFSTKPYDREFLEKLNSEYGHELSFFEVPLNHNTAAVTEGFKAVCVFVNDKVNAETIEVLHQNGIELITLRCAGFNNVDLEAAENKNIKVFRVPAYSPQSIAEHALALILTLNRKTHKAFNRIRENNYSLDHLLGFDLYHKTVGVIGTGKIGGVFAKIMLGLGCELIAFDIEESSELKAEGVSYLPLNEVLKRSDIISLHCPLTPETHHLIDKKAFSLMKKGVMLINTSRGAVIDTKEAIRALKSQKLGYLGIDVYEQEEKLFFRDLSDQIVSDDLIARLMSFPNVLITAHQGFFTQEAMTQIATVTLQNISDFEAGRSNERELKKVSQ